MKDPSSLEKKNPWICPFDDYFALNILCMFNAIKLLYCIVYCIVLYPHPPPPSAYVVWGWGGGAGYTVLRLPVIPSFRLHFRSISWERIDGVRPNFVYALTLARSRLGLLRVSFYQSTSYTKTSSGCLKKGIRRVWHWYFCRSRFVMNAINVPNLLFQYFCGKKFRL